MPPGWSGRWDVTDTVRKAYAIFGPLAASTRTPPLPRKDSRSRHDFPLGQQQELSRYRQHRHDSPCSASILSSMRSPRC
ncbi:hypothetical protein [Rhodococcus koreensis]